MLQANLALQPNLVQICSNKSENVFAFSSLRFSSFYFSSLHFSSLQCIPRSESGFAGKEVVVQM